MSPSDNPNLPPDCPLRTRTALARGCRFEPQLLIALVRERVLPNDDGDCPVRRACKSGRG